MIPKKLDKEPDDNPALTMPLSFTLDRELPEQLANFTESVIKTGSNLEQLKTEHAAAIKAAEAENRKRLDDKKKVNGLKSGSVTTRAGTAPEFKDGKPVFGSKPSPALATPASLFAGVASEQAPKSDENTAESVS